VTGLRAALALAREDRSLHRDQVLTRVIFTTLRVGSWLRERVGSSGALGRVWFKLFYLPVVVVHRSLCVLAGCDIPVGARIGRRLRLVHGFAGMFMATRAAIGDDCVFFHHVTIGSNYHTSDDPGAPVIGDRVFVGVGARIIGKITVGDDARVGAGAVVVTDVPAGATAVGPKARVIAGSAKPLKSGAPPA
jgi:serine acetyltransferase